MLLLSLKQPRRCQEEDTEILEKTSLVAPTTFLQSLNFGAPQPDPHTHCLPSWAAPFSLLGSRSLFDFALTGGP